jgi:CBS domain-containing protein
MAATGRLIGIVTTTDLIAHMLAAPKAPELPEPVRVRLQVLERIYEAAQSYVDSGMTKIAQEHLERVVQDARWAA